MPTPGRREQRNLLLRRLDEADYAALAPHLEPVTFRQGTLLFAPDEPIAVAFFPIDAVGSLVAISPEGQRVEAGLVGREGFAPTSLAADVDSSPFEASVQLPGYAYRIPVARLREVIAASATLRSALQRFAYVLSIQSAFTALSNAVHPIEERLARWLLMCDDRVPSGELVLTHEFMSVMLAVRRPSVTTALHVLEGNGLIRASRGLITIRNRAALEAFAGDAYGKAEQEYRRVLGPFAGEALDAI